MASPLRLLAAAAATSVILVAGVFVWEWSKYGFTVDAAADRLEGEVRRLVEERVRQVESLAARVAAEGRLTRAAAADAQALPALFEQLRVLSASGDEPSVAVTIYVPGSGASDFRVLAWSDGPGEKDLAPTRLAGPPATFVAPGHAGLRLIRVEPVELDGRRIAVAAAETVLAPADRSSLLAERRLRTSVGPIRIVEQYASARDEPGLGPARTFIITTASGHPLLEVPIDRAELTESRHALRRRGLAIALVPLPLAAALLTAQPVGRRRRSSSAAGRLGWTFVALFVLATAVALLSLLARWIGLPASVGSALAALGALGGVALTVGYLWWLPFRRRRAMDSLVRFVAEHLVAGLILLLAIEGARRLIGAATTPEALALGPSVLFPFDFERVIAFVAVLIGEVAIGWTAVAAVSTAAVRWQLGRASSMAAISLWLCPLLVRLAFWREPALGFLPALVPAVAAALSGAMAVRARQFYRYTTASFRLVLGFSAIVAPVVVLYPLSSELTDDATRRLVADEYAPAVAGHPQELLRELARAQGEVDRGVPLADMVAVRPPTDGQTDTQAAFLVWRRTSLSRSRVISGVELFGPDNALISRFAFNLPEYVYRTTQQVRQGSGCGPNWDVFGEATPFGAEERLMLHAERSVCDSGGRLLGGIVLHVASNDYQALPFLSSPSPYADVVGEGDVGAAVRLPGLKLVVYGWSQRPIYTTGQVDWPLPGEVFDELYATGRPAWRSLTVGDQTYAVNFSQNRGGVYAIGYPLPTPIDHASRLAEIAALFAILFITLQAGALAYAAVRRAEPAPLRLLLHEVRTSFYRKLFLSFVAVAVLPVVVAAAAFGAYMTSRFQADVEREAGSTVAVARRVLEELQAADGLTRTSRAPTDDALVWIRQVTGEDVNYFEGSELEATSQRDLFDSGLLPTRTPATVFRGIALERRPTLVTDDRVGEFAYVLAAAPVPSRGPEAILTVPLASRQRELSAELDTLNRRVMVGAVLVVLFAAVLGSSLAGRVADPVARLTRATRQIAAGKLDVKIPSESADELRTLVDDFNSMAATLGAQRAALARTNQLKAWNEMARQVAHEIKNPLTPVQLAAEHLQHVHEDKQRPLGTVLDLCVSTILTQVRLLRRIASEFANFSNEPVSRPALVRPADLVESVVAPYRVGLAGRVTVRIAAADDLPPIWADKTLVARALTNLVENAVQAMPSGGTLTVAASAGDNGVAISVMDTGPGMDEATLSRAFDPFFSTKAAGSGLGLANAKRAVEREGGSIVITSAPGAGTTVTMTLPPGAAHPGASAG